MKLKKPKKDAVNLMVKLTDESVMLEAKEICGKKFFINDYVTEAVKKENKLHKK
jgi:hypothetical protein